MRAQAGAGGCNPILTLGGRVRQRTTLVVLAVATVGFGLSLGWDWLAASGLTGVIIWVLPCLVMCAAGICASRVGGKNAAALAPPMEADSQPTAALAHAEASAVDEAQAIRHESRPSAHIA